MASNVSQYSSSVEESLSAKRHRLQQLLRSVEELQADISATSQRSELTHSVNEALSNQLFYQRSIASTVTRAYVNTSAFTSLHDANSKDSGLPSLCALEVHFLHLSPLCFPASSVAQRHTTGEEEEEEAKGEPHDSGEGEGGKSEHKLQSSKESETDSIKEFLHRFTPLFEWDDASFCVRRPYFFDEPCLMETEAVSCTNPACAYWHASQLPHMKACLMTFVDRVTPFHVRDPRLCVVSHFFAELRSFICQSSTLEALCSGVASALDVLIGLGWHVPLTSSSQSWWVAPVVATPGAASNLESDYTATLFRNAAEKDTWQMIRDTGGDSAAATRLFTQSPSELTWRGLLRAAGHTSEQRAWLAEQGVKLYPSSPALHTAYVLELLHAQAEVAACTSACWAAVDALSIQATAACSVDPPDTLYALHAARHMAYVLVRCAAALASRDTDAAVTLLSAVVEQGSSLLLTPIALTNFALLLIVLKQTGTLAEVAATLPLGAVSDQLFTLGACFPRRPQEFCGQLLNGQLELIAACQRERFDPQLLEKMKASVQLSLLRAFSVSLQYVEQILKKAAPHSETTQGVLWTEYARCVALHDSTSAARQVTVALLDTAVTDCSCLLGLLLSWHVAVYREKVDALAERCCAAFEHRHHLPPSSSLEEKYVAGSATADVQVVEWIAYGILSASQAPTHVARHAALCALPLELLVADVDGAVLWLFAMVKNAAAVADLAVFTDGVERALVVLQEYHVRCWSPLDVWYDEVIGTPHCVVLRLYQTLPALLSSAGDHTEAWRVVVLQVASRLGVLHPLLRDPTA